MLQVKCYTVIVVVSRSLQTKRHISSPDTHTQGGQRSAWFNLWCALGQLSCSNLESKRSMVTKISLDLSDCLMNTL